MVSYFVNHGSSIILVSPKGVGTFHKYIGTLSQPNLLSFLVKKTSVASLEEDQKENTRIVKPKETSASNILMVARQSHVPKV